MHDARVLQNSPVSVGREWQPVPNCKTCLQPEYPLLMNGFPDHGHLSSEERYFSYHLSHASMTVACVFGQLRGGGDAY